MPRYADWKAPDEDGQILIWPAEGEILRQTGENQKLLRSSGALIQALSLSELRAAQRKWIGHGDDAQPLIASAHQTELYHPGVWVKDVLTNMLAKKTGGQAWHLGVDTDAPKHLHLRWPGASTPITDDPDLATAPWTGLLDGPSPSHVTEIESSLGKAAATWDFVPMTGEFLAALKRLALEQPPLTTSLTNAIHQIDWKLGLRHHALMTSPMWSSPSYLVFAHHMLARAAEFAMRYNEALAQYRRDAGITSPGRPMPDLRIDADSVESAFWLDDLAARTRQRLILIRNGSAWRLEVGDGFIFDPSAQGHPSAERLITFLRAHNLRIAPRALTLTMFFRLLLADQFIHGIGGGRYDQVTDKLIQSFLGLDPPRFAVTTATFYFPAARRQRRINLHPLFQEGRRLRHGSFSREKRETAARIAALPHGSPQRRELFLHMHARLAQQSASPGMQEWQRRLDEATREQMTQKAIFDRELFFAMQPEERLREAIARYESEFAF
jgi:hypothetical protein